MSDKYIQIASFKYGLDKRRQELVSQPGVLTTCENAHINSGGEVEKRKAFVADATLFPTNTFGLQDTDQGLMTFGSDASPNAALPTGVVYQRLFPSFLGSSDFETVSGAGNAAANGVYTLNGSANGKPFYGDYSTAWIGWGTPLAGEWQLWKVIASVPTLLYYAVDDTARPDQATWLTPVGGTNPAPSVVFTAATTLAQMTKVVYSSNYLGKAFVIAQFGGSETLTFCFYDGALVESSRNGLVLLNSGIVTETSHDLSIDLAAQVNEVDGWQSFANTDVAGDLSTFTKAGATIIESPAGISFEPTVSVTSAAGLLTARLSDSISPGTGEVAASVTFTFDAGTTGTVDVQAPLNADGTGVASLLAAPLNRASYGSLTALATDLASQISSGTSLYKASSSGATVTVTVPSGFGAVTFNLTVITNLSLSTIAGGAVSGQLSMSFSPSGLFIIANNGPRLVYGHVQVKVANSVPGDTIGYSWTETEADGSALVVASGIKISSTSAPSVTFSATIANGVTLTGYFTCKVTSASATPPNVSSTVAVVLGVAA